MPTTQLGTVSPEAVRAEQLKQQQLVIEWDLRQQQRVEDVGHALLAAATPFCNGAIGTRTGVRFANLFSFSRDYYEAARSLGFSDTLMVVGVTRGSSAERSGFAVGDRLVSLDGGSAPVGLNGAQLLGRALGTRRTPAPQLTLRRGDALFLGDSASDEAVGRSDVRRAEAEIRVAVPTDTACTYNLIAARQDELNAWSDGTNVTITSAMLRFVADDDELAAVVAHEVAHNAMRHIQAKQKNAAMGGIFGAIVDIVAATQGVNTQGEFTKQGINAGSIVFSQDFEREADYVGMYLLARAGRPTAKVANFWRRMAQEDPKSIKYASTHPTTAERFVRLGQAAGEIQQKIAMGGDLRPEMRGASGVPGRALARAAAEAPRTNRPQSQATTAAAPRPKSEAIVAKTVAPVQAPLVTSAGDVSPASYTKVAVADSASYTFGPPAPRNGLSVQQVRRLASIAYLDGLEALELRQYEQAEKKLREAVRYDGGEARYHAALGRLLLKRGKATEAEAVLSAAVLLDMENAEYRELLLDARRR
jgi:hypothetical protein